MARYIPTNEILLVGKTLLCTCFWGCNLDERKKNTICEIRWAVRLVDETWIAKLI